MEGMEGAVVQIFPTREVATLKPYSQILSDVADMAMAAFPKLVEEADAELA